MDSVTHCWFLLWWYNITQWKVLCCWWVGKICQIDYSNLCVRVVFDRWFFGGNKVYLVCKDEQLLVIFRYLKGKSLFWVWDIQIPSFHVEFGGTKAKQHRKIPRIHDFLGLESLNLVTSWWYNGSDWWFYILHRLSSFQWTRTQCYRSRYG